jgi:3-deoxy-D-manno-octulosonic-acid transferase
MVYSFKLKTLVWCITMLFSFFYELALICLFLAMTPKMLYQFIVEKKYRTSLLARFGMRFPSIKPKDNGPIVWVHAVSVGETHAIAALVKKLQEEIPNVTFVISSTTETGHAEAKKITPFADYHVYLPFDFFFCVKKVLSKCTPDIIIMSEGDLWYRFLAETKKKGAISIVVNGKLSLESEKRMCRFPFFTQRLLPLIDYFCLQNELYRNRFLKTGVPASKMAITGNSKCDSLPEPLPESALNELKSKLGIKEGDFVLVIGSTHNPEEKLLLKEIAPLIQQFDRLKVILAPRHPERFAEVVDIIEKQGLTYTCWTKKSEVVDPKVFLIDAMGVLRHCYQLADIAIVAGSFTDKVGGHNILEAQVFGVPVIAGPHMYSQPHLLENALFYNAIIQTDADGVQSAILSLLNSPEKRFALRDNSLLMVSSLKGATERSLKALRDIVPQFFALSEKKACEKSS